MPTFTVKEAAAAKGVAASTVARAIQEGRLPATAYTPPGSVKGSWRIDAADLEAWTPLTDPAARGRRSGEARRQTAQDQDAGAQFAPDQAALGVPIKRRHKRS